MTKTEQVTCQTLAGECIGILTSAPSPKATRVQPRVGLDVWTDYKTQQSPWSGKRGTILTHNSPDDVMFGTTHLPQVLGAVWDAGGATRDTMKLTCRPFDSAHKTRTPLRPAAQSAG